MTTQAFHALKAATNRHKWSKHNALRYAANHGALEAYRLACQLIATAEIEG